MLIVAPLAWAGGGPPPAEPTPAVPQDSLPDPNDPDSGNQVAAIRFAPVDPVAVEKGRHMYKDYCQKCHGVDMVSPGAGFFDLRTFPPGEKPRFIRSVTGGKRAMPAWGGVLKPDDLELLWAYITSGASQQR